MADVDYKGKPLDFDTTRMLMDEELYAQIHGTVESEQDFLDSYLIAHKAKFGNEFVVG